MEDYFDKETLNKKYEELSDTYKVISIDLEDLKGTSEEVEKIQLQNEFAQDSLLLKFRKLTNLMTISCLGQVIAVLICILVILLLKL